MEKSNGKIKRILQISKYYYPEIGGIEKIAQAISDSVQSCYEIKVLCFTREKKDYSNMIKGVEVIRCGTKKKIASQPISFSIIKKLKKILKDYGPDCVIIHEPNPYMTFFLLRYIPKSIKLIVYWHSDIIKQRFGERIFRHMYYKEMYRANLVIATSPNYISGSIYLSYIKEKCVVIPNCVDECQLQITEASHEIAKKIRKENEGKIICVGIGRIVPYKGFEYLAQVASIVGDKFVFYISGHPGSSMPILEKMTKSMNNFYFIGETSDEEQKGYLEACDIFCFPSIMKSEAFGIALAEGMYFGKPAVTFSIDGSGVNYVNIDKVTGLEVKNKDINAYAQALIKLSNDERLRKKYGENARERINRNFLMKQFKENLINTLDKLNFQY